VFLAVERERDSVGGEMRGARKREMEDEERKEKERNGVATFKIQNESQINLLKCASFLIIFSVVLLYNFFNCVKKLKKNT
jgi:hypothetical protein